VITLFRRITLVAAVVAPTAAAAQTLPLKREPPAPTATVCPVFPPPPTPVHEQVEESNRLSTLAREQSLEGDHRAARDLFRQAEQLNQADPNLAYRLGREEEEGGDTTGAIHQYCRYLALAPTAGDVPAVLDRLSRLVPPATIARGDSVSARFRAGVKAFDDGDHGAAVDAFSAVIDAAPGYPPAYFDRALSLGTHAQAAKIRDFDQYLALLPDAPDKAAVRERMQELRGEIPSAGTAFALGLLPGGGQYYTGQWVLGILVTGGAAAGIVWGIQSTTVTKLHHYTDINGVPYTEPYQATVHQNLGAGIGIAGGVTLLGAIEAALVAHHRSAGLPPDSTTTASNDPANGARLALHLPTVTPAPVTPTREGIRLGLPISVEF
jgi:tetratricopeptide (TPR) repeat protein